MRTLILALCLAVSGPALAATDSVAERLLMPLSLPDMTGHAQPFSQWRGKVLVVNFWAAWCPPCRKETPGFVRLQAKHAGRNVQFVGIAIDAPDQVRAFAQRYKVNYPMLIGGHPQISVSQALGNDISGLPFTVVFDRNGQPALRHSGLLTEPRLDEILTRLSTQ